MSTIIRPKISSKNPYWIEKHRYYELKHFCLQYPIWKGIRNNLTGLRRSVIDLTVKSSDISDPTAKTVEDILYYSERIDMVEKAAKETDDEIGYYILKGVTEGLSYECMSAKELLPCSKDTYYILYRKFFWILSNMRK